MLREGNTIAPGSVQVLHINGNHWMTISTIDISLATAPYYDVTVFDSVNFTLSKSTQVLIAKLLKTT